MAKLTEQLGTVNSGKPIIDPGSEGPSFVQGLANFAAGAIPGAVKFTEERRAQNAASVLDEAAQGIFDIQRGATQSAAEQTLAPPEIRAPNYDPVSGETPADIQLGAQELLRTQRGVQQGRVSQATYDLQLERLQADLFQKYPEQRAEIASYLQSRGVDHYMFRAFQADAQANKTQQDIQANTLATQNAYAAERGLITNETSVEEGARIGREAMALNAQIAAAKEQAEQDRINLKDDQEAAAAAARATSGRTSAALIGQAAMAIDPVIQQTGIALSAAGTDAERQTILGDYRIRTSAALTQFESRGVAEISASNGTTEDINAFREYVKSMRESIDSLYTDSFETNRLVLGNMQSSFGITAALAAPMYSRTVALIGQGAANALFGDPNGLAQLAPQVRESVIQEFKSFDPTTERGRVSLARAISFMRGETQFKDLDAESAVEYLRMNNRALIANQQEVLSGTPGALNHWMPNYGNVAEAVAELNPVGTDLLQMHTATGLLANPGARTAIREAIKQDPEYGRALVQASRAASAKMLTMALGRRPSVPGGMYSITVNRETGLYEASVDMAVYNRARAEYDRRSPDQVWNDQLGTFVDVVQRPFPSIETIRGNMPAEFRNWIDVTNTNITHLVETDEFDEAIDNTMTRRQRRDAYAQGGGPARRNPNTNGTADDQFQTIVGNLDQTLQGLSTGLASTPGPRPGDRRANESMDFLSANGGFSRNQAAGIVGHLMVESGPGLNTSARNPGDGRDGSDSIGLAQWNAERAAGLRAFAGNRDINDINVQLEYLIHEFNTTEKAVGDRLRSAQTVDEAAAIMNDFLRPAGWRRGGRPENVMHWDQRLGNARNLVSDEP